MCSEVAAHVLQPQLSSDIDAPLLDIRLGSSPQGGTMPPLFARDIYPVYSKSLQPSSPSRFIRSFTIAFRMPVVSSLSASAPIKSSILRLTVPTAVEVGLGGDRAFFDFFVFV